MSGFICPHCSECSALFSNGGGEGLSHELSIPFLGSIPIDPTLTTLMEKSNFSKAFIQSQLIHSFQQVAALLTSNS